MQTYTPGPALVPGVWFEYEIIVQGKHVVLIAGDQAGTNDNVFNGTVWDDQADAGNQVPFPADTFFGHRARGARGDDFVVTVAMYHDQGLIPAKMDGIGAAANVTLGLPFIRTSVDHGTAFDRAWKGGARRPDPAGLIKAARVAIDLASRSGGRRLEWTWP